MGFYMLGDDQNPCFRKLTLAPVQRTSQAEADWSQVKGRKDRKVPTDISN